MMCFIRGFLKCEQGVVAMETLLLLPLYLMLLGGGLWLDELVSAQCGALAYGYACNWLAGNRHLSNSEQAQTIAGGYMLPKNGLCSISGSGISDGEATSWWQEKQICTRLTVKPSALSQGLFSLGLGMSDGGSSFSQAIISSGGASGSTTESRRVRKAFMPGADGVFHPSTEGRTDCVQGGRLLDGSILENSMTDVSSVEGLVELAYTVTRYSSAKREFYAKYLY